MAFAVALSVGSLLSTVSPMTRDSGADASVLYSLALVEYSAVLPDNRPDASTAGWVA